MGGGAQKDVVSVNRIAHLSVAKMISNIHTTLMLLFSQLHSKRQGQKNRSFSPNWFKEYSWLSFCTIRGKVFCYYCRKASSSLKKTERATATAFTEDGFDNWKNALQKFPGYEGSFLHRPALLSHQTSLQGSVASLLSASLQAKNKLSTEQCS